MLGTENLMNINQDENHNKIFHTNKTSYVKEPKSMSSIILKLKKKKYSLHTLVSVRVHIFVNKARPKIFNKLKPVIFYISDSSFNGKKIKMKNNKA